MAGLIINGSHYDDVKFAITAKEQQIGLMWVDYPTPIMVFPYKKAEVRKFWMKNTVSPLELIFCNARKVIEIVSGIPFNEELIGPDNPCDLVIETPAGFCYRHNIKTGTDVKIKFDKRILSKFLSV